MEKINFTNGQAPAINGANLNKIQENVENAINPLETTVNELKNFVNVIYPVGSIYITANEVNPNELFEGTQWEQIKDKFLLAAGDEYEGGSTGGAKEHLHKNGVYAYQDILTISNKNAVDEVEVKQGFTVNGTTGFTSIGDVEAYSYATEYSSNIPPYLAVYVYKRIA